MKSAALARLSGARRVLGFDRLALREPAAGVLYHEQIDVGERGHVIHKNLRLAAAVGAQSHSLEFPIAVGESRVAAELAARFPRGYALINPCAAWPNKRWPPDRYGAIADLVQHRFNLPSVVIWGPGKHKSRTRSSPLLAARPWPRLRPVSRISSRPREGPAWSCPATPVLCTSPPPSVFRRLRCSDRPNPDRNGPWHEADRSISRYAQCQCHYERRCRLNDEEWCLATIGIDEVADAVVRRLS